MMTIALYIAILSFGVALLMNIWVVARAEGVGDRVLALDTMVINAIAMMILYGILHATPVYFEVSMLFAMVGFISTVAYCRFMLRGNIIE
ncbi:K+/H+ antiporter subunit F [Rhodobacteraceae bacterium 2376]|uniref:K+/H+ antiporter subunit F n=1 Tax=Rhabdonatronobacter sediminivivens TaxID=2743469 RepID=A0A7Z0KXJ0_9RHOB|nr:K+/H+ antiporter subunit F [Rhabdonatronobacter sediminivivens]NYS24484.1 K+/H+ antiporter subunit F [Rhabdonatronobacter sediminivivens]